MRKFARLVVLCVVLTLLSVTALHAANCDDLQWHLSTYPEHPRDTDKVFVGFTFLAWSFTYLTSYSMRPGRIDFTTEVYKPPPWNPEPCNPFNPNCTTTEPPPQPACTTLGVNFPSLVAGTYDLYIDGHYLDSFTVAPTPAVPIHPAALALLAVALAAAGAVLLRR